MMNTSGLNGNTGLRRNKIALILFFFFVSVALSQDFVVKNVQFKDSGETILIRYDFNGNTEKKYHVSLLLSYDYGKSFKIIPRSLSGDVGRNVNPGIGKEIIWNLKRDYPDGLIGDGFVFAVDVKFQKEKSKIPYYAVGACVLGGAFYFIKKSLEKEPEPTTGTIIITLPDSFKGY